MAYLSNYAILLKNLGIYMTRRVKVVDNLDVRLGITINVTPQQYKSLCMRAGGEGSKLSNHVRRKLGLGPSQEKTTFDVITDPDFETLTKIAQSRGETLEDAMYVAVELANLYCQAVEQGGRVEIITPRKIRFLPRRFWPNRTIVFSNQDQNHLDL